MNSENGVLHIGIDLGTSRSSVSASNGQRHVVDSFVGWPVDMVAQKLLKKPVLVGREALENRPMITLHRPLEEGLIQEGSERDQMAVRELLRHLISLAGVNPEDRDGVKVRAVIGVPAEALRVNKQSLRNALKGIADSLMIVSEPFAVAYGLEALRYTMIIDIGAGTADFCVMKGRFPAEDDQRTLTNAGDWIDEQLAKLIRERYPDAQFSIHMVREWKEKSSFVGESTLPVMVTAPIEGKPTQLDITNEMRNACESILPPIAETMVDLLSRVEPEYQEKIRNNVTLAGGSSQITGLAKHLQNILGDLGGGRVRLVKDPVFAGSDGGLNIALDAPSSDWQMLTT
ncbi:MAG: rod shape-determining protein [Candidatus Methylomirabilales bacterium]